MQLPDRMTPAELDKAASVALLESPEGFTGPADALRWVRATESVARSLLRLYTHQCNRPTSPAEDRQAVNLERQLREDFAARGLGLYLQSDPRGAPVGILTPRSGKYNTMGGAECGWRL